VPVDESCKKAAKNLSDLTRHGIIGPVQDGMAIQKTGLSVSFKTQQELR
jgi:hypothetical protein